MQELNQDTQEADFWLGYQRISFQNRHAASSHIADDELTRMIKRQIKHLQRQKNLPPA